MQTPAYRFLRGYTLDPGFSTILETYKVNETIYRINWEDVGAGPSGEYLEIIDYDPASQCYYEAIDLDQPAVMANQGLRPSEGNPQFHQQFVYTIGMKTIEHFEKALGRKVIWRAPEGLDHARTKLRIYPHALRQANAYYSPNKKAILFGYFKAGTHTKGSNFPGGTIFTCLSPDIIAHEMTHAVLDSIHPLFGENTNLDVAAFHEGFADVVALLQRFSTRDLVEHELERTKGRMDQRNVFGSLASQMGQALQSGHSALREAIGRYDEDQNWTRNKPDPLKFQETRQAHERGALFVAAIFDAFIDLYTFKTKDLFRIANIVPGTEGIVSVDLIKRLAQEAAEIAQHLLQICIQALDYVPPFDISFGDYLRALVTADLEMAPADEYGYRVSLIQAFRSWGIYPDQLNTLSIESLRWEPVPNLSNLDKKVLKVVKNRIRDDVRDLWAMKRREDISRQSNKIQEILQFMLGEQLPDQQNTKAAPPKEWEQFMERLGLTTKAISFSYQGKPIPFLNPIPRIEVQSLRPVNRYSREGRQLDQLIVTLTQTLEVGSGRFKGLKFRGGCTIILSMEEDDRIEYLIYKRIQSERRFLRQLAFQLGTDSEKGIQQHSVYEEENPFGDVEFQHLHNHAL